MPAHPAHPCDGAGAWLLPARYRNRLKIAPYGGRHRVGFQA